VSDVEKTPEKPAEKPRNKGGRPKGSKTRGTTASVLLSDLRWVYKNPEATPHTRSRARLQAMFRDDPFRFTAQLERMEAKRLERRGGGGGGDSAGGTGVGGGKIAEDEGAERVAEMIERLLGEGE
jgi:hypothetical protein